ncbi:MAG: hypothetical protein JWO91_292 [Acidobacteriaceae bacterium]|nr:hypothetical protein [Acidobacteriaceae bacterium]
MNQEDTWTVTRKDGKNVTFTRLRDGDDEIVSAKVEGEEPRRLKQKATSLVSLSREGVQTLFGRILEEGFK